jgi:uncharacterized membrane protein YuzA (DUF378 family)
MDRFVQINLYKILIILVLIGSLNWGLVGLFNFDLVKTVSSLFGQNLKDNVAFLIYMIVGISAIILLVQRDTYLPFLGHTVMPKPMTEYNPSGENVITRTIENLPPNVKVIYWASLPSDKIIDNPIDAYGDYTNQGVTITDTNGSATLKVFKPTAYKVPLKGTLKPHIHYRYWDSAGMASRLFTLQV